MRYRTKGWGNSIRRSQMAQITWAKFVLNIAVTSALFIVTGGQGRGQSAGPKIDIQNLFTASGWMGDGEYGRKYIDFSAADKTYPHTRPQSIRVTYTFGPKRWGGIYWQNQPDNWGDKPGFDYSNKGLSKVTFWARGKLGGEVVEFKVGGINNSRKTYHDSLEATRGKITLTNKWTEYTVDLSGMDLKSVIGGFCWVASADYNSNSTITFYLDDINLE
jgi:hypothetical protein